jgi:hypothetical protein
MRAQNKKGLLAVVVVLVLLNLVAPFGINCPATTTEEYEYPGRLISIATVRSSNDSRFLLFRAFEDGTVDVKEFADDYRITLYKWARLVEPGEYDE